METLLPLLQTLNPVVNDAYFTKLAVYYGLYKQELMQLANLLVRDEYFTKLAVYADHFRTCCSADHE